MQRHDGTRIELEQCGSDAVAVRVQDLDLNAGKFGFLLRHVGSVDVMRCALRRILWLDVGVQDFAGWCSQGSLLRQKHRSRQSYCGQYGIASRSRETFASAGMPGAFLMSTKSCAHHAIMRARISFSIGIIAAAGVFAAPVASEEVKSSALIYSPWTKLCFSGMCFVGKDARTASDCVPRFGAVLIERTGETKKTLRVTVPASVDQARGVGIGIDQEQPIERPYGRCDANLCSADIDGGAELIARLRRGSKLVFDTVGANGPMHFELPLADFAAAYEGQAQEPTVFEAQPGKLEKELKAREEHGQQQDTRHDADRKTQCDPN
jgi:invasion protein IalB